ncbi:MAG: M23 family metallopeptidase [Bacteroidales bacterium]|nr:M23 family metallopeptidase [Bacteroidales bacterium]
MAGKGKYVFDKSRMEFREVTRPLWAVIWKILRYFLVTVSLAVVYYIVFSFVVSTDSERKLKREIQVYEQTYGEMVQKENLLSDVLDGLREKDSEIYRQLFNSDSPELGGIYSDGLLSSIDTVEDKDIIEYVGKKLDLMERASSRVEANLARVMAVLDSGGVKSLPPLSNPLGDFSYARTGATVGRRINPFYKVPSDHWGLDLISQQGEPVYAAADGVVKYVDHSSKGLGNVVAIDHGNGYVTRYAHLENTRVSKGQKVLRGRQIGQVGMSGNSFAPHLHYEVLKDSARLDPLNHMFASATPDDYIGMLVMSSNTGQSMD